MDLGDENIVLVDSALSHAEMAEHTESVSDALLGNVDAIGIPFITLALSGWREIRLLATRQTNVGNAARSLSLDVVGTGGGGAAGAAAGAAVGTVVLPGAGTAIGAVMGGVAGAIAGRGTTNNIKRGHLRMAIKEYEEARGEAERKMVSLQKAARRRYEHSVQAQKNGLAKSAEAHRGELEKKCAKLIQQRRAIYRISPKNGQSLLDCALAELNEQERRVKRLLAATAWMPKMLVRTARTALQKRVEHLDRLSQRLESEAGAIFGPKPQLDLVGDRAAGFLQLLLSVDGATSSIRDLVRVCERERKELEARWQRHILKARQTLADRRWHCMNSLAGTIRSLHEDSNRKMSALRRKLEDCAKSVTVEQARLGKRT